MYTKLSTEIKRFRSQIIICLVGYVGRIISLSPKPVFSKIPFLE